MVANKETWKIPGNGKEIIDSAWQDDIDKDFAIYGGNEKGEREYINRNKISKESIKHIKDFQRIKQGMGLTALKETAKEAELQAA